MRKLAQPLLNTSQKRAYSLQVALEILQHPLLSDVARAVSLSELINRDPRSPTTTSANVGLVLSKLYVWSDLVPSGAPLLRIDINSEGYAKHRDRELVSLRVLA